MALRAFRSNGGCPWGTNCRGSSLCIRNGSLLADRLRASETNKMTTTIWNCAHNDTKSFESNYSSSRSADGNENERLNRGKWVGDGGQLEREAMTVHNESIYET